MHSRIPAWSGLSPSLSLGISFNTSCRPVRLSILLSILRIMSTSRNKRRAMIFIACLFALMWCSLLIMFVTRYVSGHHFYAGSNQQDGEGSQSLAIFELLSTYPSILVYLILTWGTADILSDCPLVYLPIHLLRSIKLRRSQRRLIIAAFSSSILVTVVSLFRAVSQLFEILPFITVAIDVQVCDPIVLNPWFSHSI